jgi:hypothetical protein
VTQGAAFLLLANLDKEKELLHIFLKALQLENAVLSWINLNSFLHGESRDCGDLILGLS